MLKTDQSREVVDNDAGIDLGIEALQFLAADPVLLRRFLDLSGLDAGQLRAAAAQPAFFAGLLDFILAHEPTLLAFSAEAGVAPATVAAARRRLGGAFDTVPE